MDSSDDVAKELGRRLIERRDVKAIQSRDGSWRPVRHKEGDELVADPFTMTDLRDHLAAHKTYGHYLVSSEGTCRIFAFDIDLVKPKPNADPPFIPKYQDGMGIEHAFNPREVWLTQDPRQPTDDPLVARLRVALGCLAEGLGSMARDLLDIEVAVAYSGAKGVHVYGFLPSGTPAADARKAAIEVIEAFGSTFGEAVGHEYGRTSFEPALGHNFYRHTMVDSPYAEVEIEVFPKQDTVAEFGNLMRLPLGINLKSGQPGYFLDSSDGWEVFREDDPLSALTRGNIK